MLRAAADGAVARPVGERPDGRIAATRVRGEFLAFLARGHATGARILGRRLQALGAWIEGRLDLTGTDVPERRPGRLSGESTAVRSPPQRCSTCHRTGTEHRCAKREAATPPGDETR